MRCRRREVRGRAAAWGLLASVSATLVGCGTAVSEPAPAPSPTPDPVGPPEAAWHLYQSHGSPATLDDLVAAAADVDVILVGERHGDPGGHRFQRELLQRILNEAGAGRLEGRSPVLSLEMFESDVQPVLDEYLEGLITEEHFLAAARPWPQYRRDYRPLVEAAREAGIPVVAANAPRRYVNRVSRLGREGLDDLPDHALEHLPPLPYPEPTEAYRAEWEAVMAEMAQNHGAHGHREPPESALEAQVLWDAAMAHAVASTLDQEGSGTVVVHMVGSFHVENHTGIPEVLRQYRPGTRILVVVVKAVPDPAASPREGEMEGAGDFIVLTRDPSAS